YWLTLVPFQSSKLPWRSFLNTARNAQPCPWKSANCVWRVAAFRSVRLLKNCGSDQLPRAAASSGLKAREAMNCSAVGFFSTGGYISSPSVSLSHHIMPRYELSTFVPGWMWHTMHWLVGTPTVKRCVIGCPGSSLGMVGSIVFTRLPSGNDAAVPKKPNFADGPLCSDEPSLA